MKIFLKNFKVLALLKNIPLPCKWQNKRAIRGRRGWSKTDNIFIKSKDDICLIFERIIKSY